MKYNKIQLKTIKSNIIKNTNNKKKTITIYKHIKKQ